VISDPTSFVALPDPVPLGVAGIVTVPRSVYLAHSTSTGPAADLLLDDAARTAFIGAQLALAMRRPVTGPATAHLAQLVLEADAAEDICRSFAEKALETLRDGRRHDRSITVATTARFAVTFVAWNGTHREVQAERYGTYLPSLWATATRLTQMVPGIGAFLEIDAFVRDEPEEDDPTAPATSTFEIDVEYSYLPGKLVGGVASAGAPRDIVVVLELVNAEQRRSLGW
jgi:hypothetical protein